MAFFFRELNITPINPIVGALHVGLDANLREVFEERAAILQFEAGHSRELAEALAMLEVIRTNPSVLVKRID